SDSLCLSNRSVKLSAYFGTRSYSPEAITSWSVAAAALHLPCCICVLPSNAVAAPQVARPTSAPLYDCGRAARASVRSRSICPHTSAGLAVAGRAVGVGGEHEPAAVGAVVLQGVIDGVHPRDGLGRRLPERVGARLVRVGQVQIHAPHQRCA